MAHFTTAGKRYREGTAYASFGALDVGVTPPPAPPTTVEQTAPAELPDAGGARKFLYWDTGRRITNKRHVRWTFSHSDTWATWHAVAYYGVPPQGNGGSPVVSLDAYWVGNGSLDPTPVDGPGSSFVDGPAGQPAWPDGGNDHRVRTEWGDATIRALDHLRRSASDPELDFSSLTQLVYGGDDSSVFEENDDGLTAGNGVTGLASTTAHQLTFPQGSGGLVLAGYVRPVPTYQPPIDWRELLEKLRREPGESPLDRLKWYVDDSPVDLVALRRLVESLGRVREEQPGGGAVEDPFGGVVARAREMSATELKRTISGTRATLRRGEAALKSLESLAAKAKKTPR